MFFGKFWTRIPKNQQIFSGSFNGNVLGGFLKIKNTLRILIVFFWFLEKCQFFLLFLVILIWNFSKCGFFQSPWFFLNFWDKRKKNCFFVTSNHGFKCHFLVKFCIQLFLNSKCVWFLIMNSNHKNIFLNVVWKVLKIKFFWVVFQSVFYCFMS